MEYRTDGTSPPSPLSGDGAAKQVEKVTSHTAPSGEGESDSPLQRHDSNQRLPFPPCKGRAGEGPGVRFPLCLTPPPP